MKGIVLSKSILTPGFKLIETSVHEQIELLAQGPRTRRTKSISHSEKLSISRTSSQERPSPGGRETPRDMSHPPSSHRARISSDTAHGSSRSSFDKARKKLIGGGGSRTSHDHGETGSSLRRSESVISGGDQSQWGDHVEVTILTCFLPSTLIFPAQDDDVAMEFDSLMKSGETMKVSLTPDRLRSMEVSLPLFARSFRSTLLLPYLHTSKQARKQKEDPSSSSRHTANQRPPPPRQVHPITEDDESGPIPNKKRTASITSASAISSPPNPSSRTRTSSSANRSTPPTTMSKRPSNGNIKGRGMSAATPFDADPYPTKTRRVQGKRESMDLDDIMNGSDEEAPPAAPGKPTSTPRKSTYAVSKSTREMMDFLEQGPPASQGPPHVTKDSRDLVDFLKQGPGDDGTPMPPMSPDKKGSGRLQRMISKLSMNPERGARAEDSSSRGQANSSTQQNDSPRVQTTSLANRPVPPRFPRSVSPPLSPSEEQYGRARTVSSARGVIPPSSWNDATDLPAIPNKLSGEHGAPHSTPAANGHAKMNGHDVHRVAVPRVAPAQVGFIYFYFRLSRLTHPSGCFTSYQS